MNIKMLSKPGSRQMALGFGCLIIASAAGVYQTRTELSDLSLHRQHLETVITVSSATKGLRYLAGGSPYLPNNDQVWMEEMITLIESPQNSSLKKSFAANINPNDAEWLAKFERAEVAVRSGKADRSQSEVIDWLTMLSSNTAAETSLQYFTVSKAHFWSVVKFWLPLALLGMYGSFFFGIGMGRQHTDKSNPKTAANEVAIPN